MQLDPLVVLGAIGTIVSGVIATGLAGKWCWGYQLTDMTTDRNFWRDVALAGMKTAGKAIEVVEKQGG